MRAATVTAAWAAEDIAAAHGGGNPWRLFGWPRALARTGRAWRRHDACQGPLVLCRANGFGCTFRNLRRPIATMMEALGCALCTAPSCLEHAGMTLDSYEGCAARHLPLPLDIRAGCMACFPARACSGLESGAVSGARDLMHGEDSTRSGSSPEGLAFRGSISYAEAGCATCEVTNPAYPGRRLWVSHNAMKRCPGHRMKGNPMAFDIIDFEDAKIRA